MFVHSYVGHLVMSFFFFFFQAEDGIRDLTVTGVQTCALPICPIPWMHDRPVRSVERAGFGGAAQATRTLFAGAGHAAQGSDRKSTRLNSSHSQISYAVFCLKKKKSEQPRH